MIWLRHDNAHVATRAKRARNSYEVGILPN